MNGSVFRNQVWRGFAPVLILSSMVAANVLGGALARGETIHVGDLKVDFRTHLRPAELPARKPRAVEMGLKVSLATDNASPPPKLSQLQLRLDRHVILADEDSLRCRRREIRNAFPATALRRCRGAVLGRGRAVAWVKYPDQEPFRSRGRLLLFLGPGDSLLLYSTFPRPAFAIAVTRVGLRRPADRRFRLALRVRLPAIAGGNGRLISLRLRLGHRPRDDTQPAVLAQCPGGRLAAETRMTLGAQAFGLGNLFPC
jgi:hypothetical protein